MTALAIERRLRAFLLGLVGALCAGTAVELALAGHTKEPIQILPFVLCALGLAAVAGVWFRPGRRSILALRMIMVGLALGGLLGSYEHVQSNLEVIRETQPALNQLAALWKALQGAAPLLAPGVLAVAAGVALAATYYHPALGGRVDR